MRVGMFTYGMGDQLTGIGRYARELSYALRALDAGIEIHLLSPYPESQLPWYRDFPTHWTPSLRRLPAVATFGSAVLDRAARSLRLDILHDPCGIAPFLAPRSRTRRVVTVHDAIPYVHPELQPLLTRIVFGTLIRAARWTADAIVTDSESARADLVRYAGFPPDRIHVTPLGVAQPSQADLVRWRQGFAEAAGRLCICRPYILYVGDFNPRKNLPRLIQAFRAVRSQSASGKLVLVGPDTAAARGILSAHVGSDPEIRFLGYLDDMTLHVLYANAAAVVVPSLYEGFGLPALEAMTHGAPVVSTNRSSLPEVVGSAGLLVDPENTAALTEAILSLLRQPELREKFAREGRDRARRFTWASTARKTLNLFEKVLSA